MNERMMVWLVAPAVVVAVILGVVRLLLTPLFVQVEYRVPGFPPDTYGFTTEDRLRWAQVTLDYLLNDAEIDFLANQRFPDGTPLFNASELRHMEDVKHVVQAALRVWWASLAWLVLLGLAARRWGLQEAFLKGIALGGWWTAGLMLALVALLIVAFQTVFVDFHRIFFDAGTWRFALSDTLIRLFPERFWRDAFMLTAGLSLIVGRALAFAAQRAFR